MGRVTPPREANRGVFHFFHFVISGGDPAAAMLWLEGDNLARREGDHEGDELGVLDASGSVGLKRSRRRIASVDPKMGAVGQRIAFLQSFLTFASCRSGWRVA